MAHEPAKRNTNKGNLKHSVGGLGKKFLRMSVLYKQFTEGWEEANLDFSDQALIDMFNSESYGTPVDKKRNGYYIGKQWMGVTVAMWKEEQQKGSFSVLEIYRDPRIPWWWLDMIFPGYREGIEQDGFVFDEDSHTVKYDPVVRYNKMKESRSI